MRFILFVELLFTLFHVGCLGSQCLYDDLLQEKGPNAVKRRFKTQLSAFSL